MAESELHTVVFLAYPGVNALDLTGPHEVFAAANELADHLGAGGLRYRLVTVGAADTADTADTEGRTGEGCQTTNKPVSVTSESGLRFAVDPLPHPSEMKGTVDTLLIPGGRGSRNLDPDGPILDWVGRIGADAGRIACVCTGAFVAADAGLLTGRRVTTHWAWARSLADRHPDVEVDLDAIYRLDNDGDRPVWTSAGVTAGIDLALAIVESDLGAALAQGVARWLVVFLRRDGGQSQFAPTVWASRAGDGPIRRAQDLIDRDPAAVCSIAQLAADVGLSARHFTRRFTAEVGQSPARYLEQVRLAAARHQLEVTDDGIAVVAGRCGFGTGETLRRVFHRRLGVSPDAYRRRFSRPASSRP